MPCEEVGSRGEEFQLVVCAGEVGQRLQEGVPRPDALVHFQIFAEFLRAERCHRVQEDRRHFQDVEQVGKRLCKLLLRDLVGLDRLAMYFEPPRI